MTVGSGISEDARASLRFFAFYVGNGTLFLPREPGEDEVDYLDALVEPGPRLGQLFCVYAHACAADLRGEPRGSPSRRAALWFRRTFRPDQPLAPPVEAHELEPGCGVDWLDAVARFAVDLGEGRLAPELLAGHPYVAALTCDGTGVGSVLELIFAIFANVLALTGDEERARRRTAQHIRSFVDDEYPDPQISEEESMLWI